jgi:predicted nuclease with TOPRIM domain
LDFVLKPVRSVVRAVNEDALRPLEETERDTLEGVEALERATASLERHVEVIESLATSVGPLTESVDRLTDTMQDLVKMLGPIAEMEREMGRAEHGVEEAEHFFGFRRHKKQPEPEAGATETAREGDEQAEPGG